MALTKVPGSMTTLTKADVGLDQVDNTADADKPVPSSVQTALDAKAPINNPTFTGTVAGITKSMVGLENVDNTSDAAKPVSTAQQAALDLKAPLASPTFTGTVSGVTKAMVGLGNVDNTSDADKPVSTATQAALDLKANAASLGTAAAQNVGYFATAAQGALADSAVQPGALGTAAAANTGDFATAAQGAKADTALQSVVAGTLVSIDNTDPLNPVISASAGSVDLPGLIGAAAGKTTPVDADSMGIVDSADSNSLKELTWANVKATLKTYFDTLYQPLATALTEWAAKARPSGAVVGDTDTQTLSSKTLTAPVVNTPTLNNAITIESYAFNTSTNAAVDLANGVQQIATLTDNWTPSAWPTATAGQFLELILKQDGTGSRTVTWPSSVKWPSSTAPTITATASKGDIIHFRSDGTNWLGNVAGQVYF